MNAYIYTQNDIFLVAKAIGEGTQVGEMVFNTSLSGYQEIITDPSYAGQFIVFTMPEIGIVGVNDDDFESSKIHACGMLVRKLSKIYSNYRASGDLENLLKKENKLLVYDVDTRFLTKMLRENGAQKTIISTQISDKDELKKMLNAAKSISQIDLVGEVSTKKSYSHDKGTWDFKSGTYSNLNKIGKKVAVIDYGVKRNILNELCQTGLELEVYPHNTKAEVLIEKYKKSQINGVFLSNGPGDPKSLKNEIAEIKKIIEAKIPIFAICLGHQLLSNAFGFETYKLKFGQHGSNHPVQNLITKSVEITSQNHNYNVPEEISSVAEITHRNLFDGTIEGVRYKDYKIFSVQHHPEASAGPHESEYLFKEFLESL
nr:glutamine-hydrolyzing carbamoyl-phosphate synthase small subunit [Campylobacter sp.]